MRNHVDHSTSAAHFRIGFFTLKALKHQWKSGSNTSCNVGMKIRTLPESGPHHDILLDSEKEKWLEPTLVPEASGNKRPYMCAQSTSNVTKSVTKDVGGVVGVNHQIHQRAVNMLHQPTKMTKTTSIVDPSLIERRLVPTKSNQLPQTDSSATTQSWANGSWYRLETLTRLMEPIRIPQLVMDTSTQKDHSQETDGHN